MSSKEWKGVCLCNSVEVSVKGQPWTNIFCHCSICRRWTGAPFSMETVLPQDALTIIKGSNNLSQYKASDAFTRYRCTTCGQPIYIQAHVFDGVVVPLPLLFSSGPPDQEFVPTAHTFYENRVMDIKDGLTKHSASLESETIPE